MKTKCLVCFMSLLFLWACDGTFSTTIETKYGEVKGFLDADNTLAWKGIPYAKPPVDELRWKAPADPEPWDGIQDATEDCDECSQITTIPPEAYIGSEDCLYLNIWRPQSRSCNLPVYFWIHGGGNSNGTAKDYDGSVLASRSNMVVVSIQYRLGPLGWLSHAALRHSENSLDDSGNFGTLDTIKALEWVRDNIRAFGGNPRNILIAGHSAGAHNVMNLVISPLANGLFHKALSQSNFMKTSTVDYGGELAESMIANLLAEDGLSEVPGGDVEGYLRGKGAEELIVARYTAIIEARDTGDLMRLTSAYQDGFVIPDGGVIPAIESGNYNKVPIIVGSNEDEMKFCLPNWGFLVKNAYLDPEDGIDVPIPSSDYTWLDLLLGLLFGSPAIDDVLPTDDDKTLYQACAEFGSLKFRHNFVDAIARSLREQQNEVYAYLLKWDGIEGSDYDFIFGAAHSTEIPFFFGGDTDLWGGIAFSPENDTPGRRALSEAMMKYVANFACTGNPSSLFLPSGLPVWKKWSNREGEPKVIVFDATETDIDIGMISEEITSDDVDAKFSDWHSRLPAEVRDVLNIFDWF